MFLGLTLDCARCHDHKFDPIPQTDYYRLLAFFHDVRRYGDRGDVGRGPIAAIDGCRRGELQKQEIAERQKRLAEIERQMKAIEDAAIAAAAGRRAATTSSGRAAAGHRRASTCRSSSRQEEYERVRGAEAASSAELERKPAAGHGPGAVRVTSAAATPPTTFVLRPRQPAVAAATKVEPGFPAVLSAAEPAPIPRRRPARSRRGRRPVLADWIAARTTR